MNTSQELDKISPAILAAQSEMGLVGKSGDNKFHKYKYANLEDYYRVCRNVFHQHGVFITENISHHSWGGEEGNPKGRSGVMLDLRLTHSSGQWIEISSCGEGEDSGDKATYKAITGARKYAIAMAANLVTSDDPEKDDGPPKGQDKDRRPTAASQTSLDAALQPEQYQGEI